MKITVALHNIRSVYNVGAILRTAEGFSVEKVVLSGYTPWYKKPGLLPHLAEKLERHITKTAVGADKMVNTEWVDDLPKYLDETKLLKLGLENNLDDPRLQNLRNFRSRAETEAILVLGEEVEGIPPEILEKLDVLLEIPMCGQKESFNVSVATGIALYELTGQKDSL